MKPSGTGPSASVIRPSTVTRSPATPGGASSARVRRASPREKNGPTVWDGVALRLISPFKGGGLGTAEHDVEPVAQRELRDRRFPIEHGDEPIAGVLVRREVEDRVAGEQRIAWEIHLRHQARGERGPEDREVNVGGPPGIVVVAPGIG